jgi:hypothetical protein
MKKMAFMLALLLCSSSAFDFNPVILIKRALSSDSATSEKTLGSKFTTNKKAPGITAGFSRDDRLGVVRDDIYKLMWQDDNLPDKMTHYNAASYCEDLIFAGYSDWRLPTVNELLSITDDSKYDPAINLAFNNTKLSGYWSSTEHVGYVSSMRTVYFDKGEDSHNNIHSANSCFVRCVRQY